jgi:hypothetical protein
MAYSVNLLFSAEAEGYLASLQQKMKEAGVPGWTAQAGYRPHLEIGYFISIDPVAMKPDLKRFALQHSPIELNFNRIELLGNEVIMRIEPDPALMAFHQALHNMSRKYGKSPKPESAPGVWQPKLSLIVGVTPENLERVKPILGSISLPWTVTADTVGVFLINPTRIGVQAEAKLGSGQMKDRTY